MVVVILCGGVGSRLWPVSRVLYPKQFIKLPDGESLIQKTFTRAAGIEGIKEVVIVTNRDLHLMIKSELGDVNSSGMKITYILEPFGRSTAPAVAIAAHYISTVCGDSPMIVLAADHLVLKETEFFSAIRQAGELAKLDKLVVFGIKPTSPDTGYGYVEASGNNVLRFTEKPSLDDAIKYVNSGNYYWNSGMFYFRTNKIIEEYQKYASDVYNRINNCIARTNEGFANCDTDVVLDIDPTLFAKVPDISIDYAIMEKSTDIAIVPCDIGWTDIGSWSAYGNIHDADGFGNRTVGDVLTFDTKNCFIQSDGRLVATVGLDDLIIVDTKDALLIANRTSEQDIKKIYNTLKERKHEAHRSHPMVYRPWGSYELLQTGSRFKIKHIRVKPGESLSLQLHHHRSEHWIVVQGSANVHNDGEDYLVMPNESIYIKAGHKHRVSNPGIIDLVIIEVQCGEYLGEDDIERFDDIYGRA